MAEQREEWGSRAGFLLAAIGSAVGLGNIWRFPYVAYDNGGGAFVLPYLVALITAGIPILVLEYGIGHRFRGSAPLSMRRLHRKAEVLGWWQVGVCFVISSYYAVVIAWAAAYTGFSFDLAWGDDPEGFLFDSYWAASEPWRLGGIRLGVLVPLVAIWLVTLGVLVGGVRRGVERANRILLPLLLVTFGVLVVRAVTLPGAMAGLDALFTPDWASLRDSSIWVAAYGQIFFSLSVGFAIMITYASYLPRRGADLTTNAFIAGFANSSFELLAGIGVFAAIGFLAGAQGVGVDEVAAGGVGLAFVVFPAIVSELPGLNRVFGVLFFASLVAAGLSSLISITEASTSAVMDKFGWSRARAVAVFGGATALVSLVFATGLGPTLLDVVDNFINSFGVAVVGLVEVVALAWILRRLPELRRHADRVSALPLGGWWSAALVGVTPLLLGAVTIDNLRRELTEPYEGLPAEFLLLFGWGAAAIALTIGLAFTARPWHDPTLLDFVPEEVS
ncbi:MAG TPA: sodium-dependent transporter [Egicoccus sp.]|nr:sodium-dependent transporter [Egicoccus sp.]HSK24645.1 sodium-dependent transporter [Egicoccus sp.]